MSASRVVLGGLLAAAMATGVVALSHVPYTAARGEDGELRLAWRWRSERVERCRRLGAEELAKLPTHMRRTEACERQLRPYVLDVTIDGAPVAHDTLRAAGAESDRPLYVFRRIAVAPGRHAAHVVFAPVGPSELAPLMLDAAITVSPRHVVLITLDADRGVLAMRSGEP